MQTYPLDIEPGQVVRWIIAERRANPSEFRIVASRGSETRELPAKKEFHLGDEEREDLSETATVATLQIAPADPSDGWLLTIVVEDEIGPAASSEAETADEAGEEQEIGAGTFYDEFMRPGRGNASISAEVEGPRGNAHLTRLIKDIEQDRHAADRGRPPR